MAHEKAESIVASARTNFSAFQRLCSTAIYILCVITVEVKQHRSKTQHVSQLVCQNSSWCSLIIQSQPKQTNKKTNKEISTKGYCYKFPTCEKLKFPCTVTGQMISFIKTQ